MTSRPFLAILLAPLFLSLAACGQQTEAAPHEVHKITATSPQSTNVTITERYVCQIHWQRHIKVRALEMGYLEAIQIKEGQSVKENDPLFTVRPILYQTRFEAEKAEADLAQLELNYTKKLYDDKVVSLNQVKLLEVKLAKAKAK